ncbi:MAG: metallophosphoesterase family protein [Phycisphaerae bacterium]|nr:metallophosphoesterase family protein [Phycisphaerae bacterium]
MLAIISDIHSNVEALRAVLDDIASRDVETILCLGDVVGYGPDPVACVALIRRRVATTLMGNHDAAVVFEPSKFNMAAESSSFWTRAQIEAADRDARRACWDFLGMLPVNMTYDASSLGLGEISLVHGSPRRPVNEYVFPDDVYTAPNKVQGQFERFDRACFCGHTHVPGVFTPAPDFYAPDELNGIWEFDGEDKALINVGSVGQPRDRDPRAAYVLLEPKLARFIRVEYDAPAVAEKVYEIAELDDYLGTRLREGR